MIRFRSLSLISASLLSATLLAGCGANSFIGSSPVAPTTNAAPGTLSGKLYGGPNPVVGATVKLYVTGSGYGTGATSIATTTTDSSGFFNLSLPTTSAICATGQYLYVTSYAGNTGANTDNASSLLMVPIGSCSSNYTIGSTTAGGVTTYTNTYTGPNLWINELTTAISAYALSGFMSVTGSTINIGAPAANTALASNSPTTPSAAGLAHAFSNALNLVNISTGQPYAFMANRTSGGVIPDGEIFLLGNILQACVNSAGVTGTNTATSNDGTACGKLFSLTTPPTAGAVPATNTMGAMLNLAHYPNPTLNTWSTDCTAAGAGTKTATSCIFGIAPSLGAGYPNAMTSAPLDWVFAVVYPQGYGLTACTTGSTCSGINYPYHVALDYQDNVFVLDTDASTPTYTAITGLAYDGTILFTTPQDTTYKAIKYIGTDTDGHVFGANSVATGATDVLRVYSTTDGSVVATPTISTSTPIAVLADAFNNVFIQSSVSNGNTRKFAYGGTSAAPVYTQTTITGVSSALPVLQLAWDTKLDLIYFGGSSTAPAVYILPNNSSSTSVAPTFSSPSAFITTTITGSTSNAYGVTVDSSNNIWAVDSVGLTKVTESGSGTSTTLSAGTPITLTPANGTALYTRYVATDGNNILFAGDNGSGTSITGVTAYDTVNNLSLGIYRGCYVISGACGTTSNTVPAWGTRGEALDSAGDIWIAASTTKALTEFIGAAAPTWPALSMGRFGRPQ